MARFQQKVVDVRIQLRHFFQRRRGAGLSEQVDVENERVPLFVEGRGRRLSIRSLLAAETRREEKLNVWMSGTHQPQSQVNSSSPKAKLEMLETK